MLLGEVKRGGEVFCGFAGQDMVVVLQVACDDIPGTKPILSFC